MPLAWQQYQELNFTFYAEQPSDFINMRVELLSLLLCDEEQLASAYSADRSINGLSLGASTPPDLEKRKRVLRTEAVVVLHHAAEMLFRLFFAHLDDTSCPWKGVATTTAFSQFKERLERSLAEGFARDELARVFLGGTTSEEAGVKLSPDAFNDAIDGLNLLLITAADRLLSEAFLYNSIKHGLSTVALDESTQIVNQFEGEDPQLLHSGPMFAYMHKQRRPGPRVEGEREWYISLTGARTEQDLALTVLIARAIESLWAVARRAYTGKGGSIRHIGLSVVESVAYGMLESAGNLVDTIRMEMPKLNPDGSMGKLEHDIQFHCIPDEYEPRPGLQMTDCPQIELPVRQQDRRVFSTSRRKLFPFSPNGSQRV